MQVLKSSLHVNWKPLSGGKHVGNTLPQVLLQDPNYFFCYYEPGGDFFGLAHQAEIIATRAKNMLIPSCASGEQIVIYSVSAYDPKKFGGVTLVSKAVL